MNNVLFAIKHKLVVQFSSKLHQIKMKTIQNTVLDGSEKSMIPVLRDNYASLSVTSRGMVSLEEFSAGTGIADLVFFGSAKTSVKKRASKKIPAITSIKELELISIIDGNVVTEEEISKRIGRSRSYTEKLLQELLTKRVVMRQSDGYTTNLSFTDSTISKSIAIEAKVKDWKSGIRQALRYKEFADYSYLAIYESNSMACMQRLEMFQQLGIGLLLVSNDGQVSEAVKPAKNTSMDSIRHFLASERYFSIVDQAQEAFVVRNFLTS